MGIDESIKTQLNKFESDLYGYASRYGNLFASGLFNSGIIKDVTPEQLQKYFASPDVYQDIISDISEYFYIISGEIHQMYEMIEALPKLTYKIKRFDTDENTEVNILKIKKYLHKINHKRLTRDLLKQLTSYGNVAGVWLGKKSNFYPYIFTDFEYVSSGFRNIKGNWQLEIDAGLFQCIPEQQRNLLIREFKPLMSKEEYNLLLKGELLSFIVPEERTIFLGTGKLNRNQFVGTSWIAPVMLDVLHKRKLKDVEQTVANKIINAVAVLTVGSFDGKDSSGDNLSRDFNKIPEPLVNNLHDNVKRAISDGKGSGISLITLPNFADIKFPKIDSDALDGGKFNQTNSDILTSIGTSGAALNGSGANYNSAKLNLEIFYTRLGVLLEEIEFTYNNFINLNMDSKYKDNYFIEYAKDVPLSTKDKIQHLKGLNDKGWSTRTYIEELGYDFDSMLAETREEVKMGINVSLIPPPTSFTTSGDNIMGAPEVDDTESDATLRSRENY